ncbi:hypothetical protein [Cochleicola gelatinilyticus]|uniref:hypothetical protein n=1 Tax=Cochleicola gelatinilyticus TaxID=1763537 RepID=UPI000A9DAE64|nr:hypothetical protein [Cochleicola gelatinilyticus]
MSKKGSAKNTKNKAKHAKLMAQKKNKEAKKKADREARLKELNKKINAQKK